MRRFKINKIHALDGKGRTIAGTIEPAHSDYSLDSEEGNGKAYLFALARKGQSLERAESLLLEVQPASDSFESSEVQVKVLYIDIFGLDRVSSGEYWDELPQIQRFRIQDKLADEIMERAKPLFPFQREAHPYQGVTFAVSGLDELESLFPPE